MSVRASLRRCAAGMRRLVAVVDLNDVFAFGGIGCAAYGIAQVHRPAAWIFTGLVLLLLGLRR